jgi:hypothetical protein
VLREVRPFSFGFSRLRVAASFSEAGQNRVSEPAEIPVRHFSLATLVTLGYRTFGWGSYSFRALAVAP